VNEGADERETRLKEEFNEALRLRDAGELGKARQTLERLAQEHPTRSEIVGMLAGLQYQAGDHEQAAATARNCIALSPRSELASRIVFHACLELEDVDSAFAEAARFRAIKDSPEYDRTLAEMDDGTLRALRDRPHDALLRRVLDRVREELSARPVKQ
jgi:predicted Zn-dependent protease